MNFKNLFGLTCAFGLAATSAFALPKATDLVADMGLGYNIGNTMEVPGNPTAWGNDFPTAEYVKAIKAAGFNTVRIPCAWDSHASNGTINAGWLDSVKTVVDLVIGEGMYAMLNSHWDNGWLEDHVFDGMGYDKTGEVNSSAATVAAKQESYWKQIATKFAAYDEHLIFASANEPGVNDPWFEGGTDGGQWGFDENRMKVLKSFHEACIKSVRAAGGNNATRTIIVQAPRTEIDKAPLLSSNMPTDPAGAGYIMAEVHYYPYQYSLMTADEDWGTQYYYYYDMPSSTDKTHNMGWNVYSKSIDDQALGTPKQIAKAFGELKTMFCDKGIPVVIGEMGAVKRLDALTGANLKLHLEGRAAWYGEVAKVAKASGIIPCVWDTGDEGNGNFTIVRRQTKKFGGNVGDITDYETLNAMRAAYGMTAIEGNSIDALVNASLDESNKMLEVTYNTVTSDSSEVGTLRFNVTSKNWSNYTAISFQAKIDVEATGPVDDVTWMTLSLFAMSGDDWAWSDYNFAASDLDAGWATYTVTLDADGLDIENKAAVNAFGFNLYGTQLKGKIDFDNIRLIKADGSAVVLADFDKKLGAETDGIASATRVTSTAPNSGSSAIKPVVASASKMFVNVQQGFVNATFSATEAVSATAKLVNGLGQVIASQNFTTRKGSNTVQLKAAYRGPAMLIIKQGSQMQTQKVILK
ncbi:MAG: glycoside hydrolase family 5 protein [Fibrobacter sp.]|nr:glycoside hydrolase family 5 protein [Fibrobacter sp.]